MHLNQFAIISPDVIFQEVSGETVLLDLASEHYFGLDEVGSRIWQLLQEEKELQKVFDILSSEYDVDPDRLAMDLADLLGQLSDAKLIVLEPLE